MRSVKAAAIALVAVGLGVVLWAAYRAGWRPRQSPRAPGPPAQNAELPVVEYREAHSGPAGETGSLLTIDRTGQASLQTIPLGPRSKTTRTHLTCDELAWLPQAMKNELALLRSSYGSERTANQGEVSVVYRWGGPEKRVIWRNPESSPKPPEGVWAGLVAPLEDIRRRAEEPAAPASDVIFVYGHSSSGYVGTDVTLLSVHKSGRVILRDGLGLPWPAGETQLAPGELTTLLGTIEEAKFEDFQPCYGRHAPVNPQNTWMVYWRDRREKEVMWMSDPADPKPPEGWFRLVGKLDQIRARAEKEKHDVRPATSKGPAGD